MSGQFNSSRCKYVPCIFYALLCYCFFFHPTQVVQAQGPVVLTDEQDEYPLGLHLEILEDPTKQLTIEDVISPEFETHFVPSQVDTPNYGFTESTYWVRFRVHNESQQNDAWWLELARNDLNLVTLYIPSENDERQFVIKQAGDWLPVANHEIPYHYIIFNLPLRPTGEQVLYVQVQGANINLPLTLWSEQAFWGEYRKDFLFIGLFLGIFLIMSGYNLFLYFSLKDKSYLYYVLFIAGFIVQEVVTRGWARQYMWPEQTGWNTPAQILAGGFLFVCLLRFTDAFLLTAIHTPRLRYGLNALQWVLTGLSLIMLFFRPISLIVVWVLLILLGVVTAIATGIVTWRRGYRPARYFLLAWVVLFGASFLSVLTVLGFGSTAYTEFSVQTGLAFMALLFSLALVDRINTLQHEREQAQTEALQLKEAYTVKLATTNANLKAEIVEHEKTEASLRQSELVVQALLNAPLDAMLLLQKDGTIGALNAIAAQRMGRKSPADLVGVSLDNLFSPATVQHRRQQIEQAFQLKEAVRFEDKDGDRWLDNAIYPVFNAYGEATQLVVLARDITQRKEAEAQLKRYSEQLEDMVEVRTQALETVQIQLIQQEKLSLLGQVAAGLAHELRNLLAVIANSSYLLQMVIPTPNELGQEHLQIIKGHVGEAEGIIASLLDIADAQVPHPVGTDLKTLITGILEQYPCPSYIKVVWSLTTSLPVVYVDQSQITQALANLIINAYQAMPQGGQLTFSAQVREEAMCLSLIDSGLGMSQETVNKVFEPFYTTKAKGIGLGLSIAKNLVENNNGRISVESIPNQGTTFIVQLPLA